MAFDNIEMGNRAREVRIAKNIKQIEISNALGITQPSYSKFEYGQYDMPISQLVKLCEILDVPLSWLVGEDIITDLTDSERRVVEEFIKYVKNIKKKL